MNEDKTAKNILSDKICLYCLYSTEVLRGYEKIDFACTLGAWERANAEAEKHKEPTCMHPNPLDFIQTISVSEYHSCENWSKNENI